MRLQYQLSNGIWVDCMDRDEEFLRYVVANNSAMTHNEIITALMDGKKLRNDPEDWYSYCRSAEAAEKAAVERVARERAAYEAAINAPQKLLGQFWEECPQCGHSPVYLSHEDLIWLGRHGRSLAKQLRQDMRLLTDLE